MRREGANMLVRRLRVADVLTRPEGNCCGQDRKLTCRMAHLQSDGRELTSTSLFSCTQQASMESSRRCMLSSIAGGGDSACHAPAAAEDAAGGGRVDGGVRAAAGVSSTERSCIVRSCAVMLPRSRSYPRADSSSSWAAAAPSDRWAWPLR